MRRRKRKEEGEEREKKKRDIENLRKQNEYIASLQLQITELQKQIAELNSLKTQANNSIQVNALIDKAVNASEIVECAPSKISDDQIMSSILYKSIQSDLVHKLEEITRLAIELQDYVSQVTALKDQVHDSRLGC